MKMPKLIAKTARLPHIAPSQPDTDSSRPVASIARPIWIDHSPARQASARTVGTFTTGRHTVATEKKGTKNRASASWRLLGRSAIVPNHGRIDHPRQYSAGTADLGAPQLGALSGL